MVTKRGIKHILYVLDFKPIYCKIYLFIEHFPSIYILYFNSSHQDLYIFIYIL